MTVIVFQDEDGNELTRMSDVENPELRDLGLGDRIGDGRGGKVRLVKKSISMANGEDVIVTWTVVRWIDDWSASVSHADDGKILGLLNLEDLPAPGDIIDVPLLQPDRAASPAMLSDALPYVVVQVVPDSSTQTAAITVRHLEGGLRQIGL